MALDQGINRLYTEIVSTNPGPGGPPPRGTFRRDLGPGALRAQLNNLIGDVRLYTEASIKLCVLESIQSLLVLTPKDTTWAATSWFPGYGGEQNNGGYLVAPDVAESLFQGGLTALDAAGATRRLAQRQQGQDRAIVSFVNTRIFVNQSLTRSPEFSNGVPYIEDLNRGSSDQAPAGFVDTGIRLGLAQLESRATKIAVAGAVGGRGTSRSIVGRVRSTGRPRTQRRSASSTRVRASAARARQQSSTFGQRLRSASNEAVIRSFPLGTGRLIGPLIRRTTGEIE